MNANIIQARYADLDLVATRFARQAETTAMLDSRVRQCLQALEQGGWEGRGAAAFFAEMNGALLPAMQRMSHALDEARAVTLQIKEIIMEAEREAAAPFGSGLGAGHGGDAAGWLHDLLAGAKGKSDALKLMKGGLKVLAALGLTYTMRDGKVIISGGKMLKRLAGLNPNLTSIKPENLPGHMARRAFGKGGILLSLVSTGISDTMKYRKDGATKVISAIAVDSAIKIPTGVLSTAAGGLVVAGAATAIGVTAPAIVIVAGGAAVGVGIGMAAERVGGWIESKTHIRERAIDALDSGLRGAGRGVSSAADHVDGAIDSAVDAISGVRLW